MLSYADRAKSRPRNSPTDPQPSTSLTNNLASMDSTAPSSVSGTTQSEEKQLDGSLPLSTQIHYATHSTPAESTAQTNGDVTHDKAALTALPPIASTAKVNVWTQRAQARALSQSAIAKFSPASGQAAAGNLNSTENTLQNSGQNQTTGSKIGANGTQIGGITINEQEWPEVGPSFGNITRSNMHIRSHSEKDSEHNNLPTKKGLFAHNV
jgi:hypothetical protein